MSDMSFTPARPLRLEPTAGETAQGSFLGDLWRLCVPYFKSPDRWIAIPLLVLVITFNFSGVFLSVVYNEWNGRFFNSLEKKDQASFFREMSIFSVLATLFILNATVRTFTNRYLQLRWRRWLTKKYLTRWLSGRAYYHLEIARSADNPDQRIAEDIRLLLSSTMLLSMGFLSAVLTLVSFLAILWTLSGPYTFSIAGSEITIPGYMVWAAFLYALLGTLIAHFVGRPLIGLNFRKQRLEANFRFGLVRTRENSEAIALYAGEGQETEGLTESFTQVLANYWKTLMAELRLSVYSVAYDQAAVIFPFIVASPRYFAAAITLGTLMQISQAFSQVQSALSFFVTNYADLAEWRAVINRLRGFDVAVDAAMHMPEGPTIEKSASATDVSISGLDLVLPSGRHLADNVELRIRRGDRLLIGGLSGAGKSTFFRAISGIWPYGKGRIVVPAGARSLFLPQRPYMPIGTLRDVVVYPDTESTADDGVIAAALRDVQLAGLADNLDEHAHWANRLSGGEQQRLAAARALLYKPDYLFLDEASASLDETAEAHIYQLLRERLPNTAIVSIGHRASLRQWHERQLEFAPGADGRSALVASS
jgi:putative ATP-binding cassette transporter